MGDADLDWRPIEPKDAGVGFVSGSLVVDADSPTGAVGLYERVGFTVKHTSITQAKRLLP